MKIKMCRCLWSGLIRPKGPIQIKETRIVSPDVMVGKISGKVSGKVAVVKVKNKFYFKGPKALGGICEVPADHLTDAMNYKVWELNSEMKRKKA